MVKKKKKKATEAALFQISDADLNDAEKVKKKKKKKKKHLDSESRARVSDASSLLSAGSDVIVASYHSEPSEKNLTVPRRKRKATAHIPLEPITPLTSLEVLFTVDGMYAPVSMIARLLVSPSLMSCFLLTLLRGRALDTAVPFDRVGHLQRSYGIELPEGNENPAIPLNTVVNCTVATGNVAQMVVDGCKLIGINPVENRLTKPQLSMFLQKYKLLAVLDELLTTATLDEAEQTHRYNINKAWETYYTEVLLHYRDTVILPWVAARKIQSRWRCKKARKIFFMKLNLLRQGLADDNELGGLTRHSNIDVSRQRRQQELCGILTSDQTHDTFVESELLVTAILCHVTASERPAVALMAKELLLLGRAYAVQFKQVEGQTTVWHVAQQLVKYKPGLNLLIRDALDLSGVQFECGTISVDGFMQLLVFFDVEAVFRDELVNKGCLGSAHDLLGDGLFCLLSQQPYEAHYRKSIADEESHKRAELHSIQAGVTQSAIPKRRLSLQEPEVRIPLTAFNTDRELILYGDTEDFGKILVIQRTWRTTLRRKKLREAALIMYRFSKTVARFRQFKNELQWLRRRRKLLRDPHVHLMLNRVRWAGKGYLDRLALHRLRMSNRLQRVGRGYFGRLIDVWTPMRIAATTVLQRTEKGRVGRHEVFLLHCREWLELQQTKLLQKVGRGCGARFSAGCKRVESVRLLQRAGRGFALRMSCTGSYYKKRVLPLQRVGRAAAARASLVELLVRQHEEEATKTLQRAGRGMKGRSGMNFSLSKVEWLQRAGRGGFERKQLSTRRAATRLLCKVAAGVRGRVELKDEYNAAVSTRQEHAARVLGKAGRGCLDRVWVREQHVTWSKIAIMLQCKVRQWRAQARCKMLARRKERQRRRSQKIFSALRMKHAREALQQYEEIEAANKIRTAWSAHMLRRTIGRRVEATAAVRIQSAWRCFHAKQIADMLRRKKTRSRRQSASKIQRVWRMGHARRALSEEESSNAAATIQRMWGTRRAIAALRHKVRVKRFQRVGRACMCRCNLYETRSSKAQYLQGLGRAYFARRSLARLSSALHLQHLGRAYLVRTQLAKHVCRLQRLGRACLARHGLMAPALCIQRIGRGHLARYDLTGSSITQRLLLQRIGRAYFARRLLQVPPELRCIQRVGRGCLARGGVDTSRRGTVQLAQRVGRGMVERRRLAGLARCVVVLQRMGRGSVGRHNFARKREITDGLVERYRMVRVLQRCSRAFIEREALSFVRGELREVSVRVLQCAGRGCWAREALQLPRHAAYKLQRGGRAMFGRLDTARKHCVMEYLGVRERATTLLQRMGRATVARVASAANHSALTLAATTVQKGWRRYRATSDLIDEACVEYKVDAFRSKRAASKVQQHWRDCKDREAEKQILLHREFNTMQKERRRRSMMQLSEVTAHAELQNKKHRAARLVQRAQRGHAARQALFKAHVARLSTAVPLLQCVGRGMLLRDYLNCTKAAAALLHRVCVGWQARLVLSLAMHVAFSGRDSTSSEVSAVCNEEAPDLSQQAILIQSFARTKALLAHRARYLPHCREVITAFAVSYAASAKVVANLGQLLHCMLLQRVGKGFESRRVLRAAHLKQKVMKIQSVWRGVISWKVCRRKARVRQAKEAKLKEVAVRGEKVYARSFIGLVGRAYLMRKYLHTMYSARRHESHLRKMLRERRDTPMIPDLPKQPTEHPRPRLGQKLHQTPEVAPLPPPPPPPLVPPRYLAKLIFAVVLCIARVAGRDVRFVHELVQQEKFLRFLLEGNEREGLGEVLSKQNWLQGAVRIRLQNNEAVSRRHLAECLWLEGCELMNRNVVCVYEGVGRDVLVQGWRGEWEREPTPRGARRRRTRLLTKEGLGSSGRDHGVQRIGTLSNSIYRRGTVSEQAFTMHTLEINEVRKRDEGWCLQEDLRTVLDTHKWYGSEVHRRGRVRQWYKSELLTKVTLWNVAMLELPSTVVIGACAAGVVMALHPSVGRRHDKLVVMTAAVLTILCTSMCVIDTMDCLLSTAAFERLLPHTFSSLDVALQQTNLTSLHLKLPLFPRPGPRPRTSFRKARTDPYVITTAAYLC